MNTGKRENQRDTVICSISAGSKENIATQSEDAALGHLDQGTIHGLPIPSTISIKHRILSHTKDLVSHI